MPFERVLELAAPPSVVWSLLIDVKRWPDWSPACRSVRPEQPGALALGSTAMLDLRGRPGPERWTVTEFVEGRCFVWATRPWPGMRVEGGHSVESEGSGSRVRLWIGGRGPLGTVMDPIIGRMARDNVTAEGDGLKRRSEEIASG